MWASSASALACTSVLFILTSRGVIDLRKPERERGSRCWSLIAVALFVFFSIVVTVRNGDLSKWVLLCSVLLLNELVFRYLFLFESVIASVLTTFRTRAIVQSVCWSVLLVAQQCIAGAPAGNVAAMFGGYLCLGVALAYVVRKTGSVQSSVALMEMVTFVQLMAVLG